MDGTLFGVSLTIFGFGILCLLTFYLRVFNSAMFEVEKTLEEVSLMKTVGIVLVVAGAILTLMAWFVGPPEISLGPLLTSVVILEEGHFFLDRFCDRMR